MKVCDNCQRANWDEAEVCAKCGGDEFTNLLFPFYDNWEPYEKENDNE